MNEKWARNGPRRHSWRRWTEEEAARITAVGTITLIVLTSALIALSLMQMIQAAVR